MPKRDPQTTTKKRHAGKVSLHKFIMREAAACSRMKEKPITNKPETTLSFAKLRQKAIWLANYPSDTRAPFSKIIHDMTYECQIGMVEDMARYCEENAHD